MRGGGRKSALRRQKAATNRHRHRRRHLHYCRLHHFRHWIQRRVIAPIPEGMSAALGLDPASTRGVTQLWSGEAIGPRLRRHARNGGRRGAKQSKKIPTGRKQVGNATTGRGQNGENMQQMEDKKLDGGENMGGQNTPHGRSESERREAARHEVAQGQGVRAQLDWSTQDLNVGGRCSSDTSFIGSPGSFGDWRGPCQRGSTAGNPKENWLNESTSANSLKDRSSGQVSGCRFASAGGRSRANARKVSMSRSRDLAEQKVHDQEKETAMRSIEWHRAWKERFSLAEWRKMLAHRRVSPTAQKRLNPTWIVSGHASPARPCLNEEKANDTNGNEYNQRASCFPRCASLSFNAVENLASIEATNAPTIVFLLLANYAGKEKKNVRTTRISFAGGPYLLLVLVR